MHNYTGALKSLANADQWKAAAQAYASRTNQKSVFNADAQAAEQVRNLIAQAASYPQTRYVPAPVPRYYQAPSQDCEEDSIQTVGDDGAVLEMLSGAVYHVADYDKVTSSIWLATDDVLICGTRIINKDENGETVDATRVR